MCSFDTLFLDRDGVINHKLEGRYVREFREFIFMPGFLNIIPTLYDKFNRIIIITNQQGIGKGIMSASDLNLLHAKMEMEIQAAGGKIDKIYYCPHLVSDMCKCRKPNTGMIEQAIIDFPDIIVKDSYLIGDSESDIEAGRRMKLNTVKVDNISTLAEWASNL